MKIITLIKNIQIDDKTSKLVVELFWYSDMQTFGNSILLNLDPADIEANGIDVMIQKTLPAAIKEQRKSASDVTEIATADAVKADKIAVIPPKDDAQLGNAQAEDIKI